MRTLPHHQIENAKHLPASTEAGLWDFFFRGESNRINPKDKDAQYVQFHFPAGTTLAAALNHLLANGVPFGSHRGGIFEVQTPDGIFGHRDDNRIDLTTPGKAAKVWFLTWDQLENSNDR